MVHTKSNRRTAMAGLNASTNTKAAMKEKRCRAKEQQGMGGSERSKAGSLSQPPPLPLAPTPLQVIDSSMLESSQSRADQHAG